VYGARGANFMRTMLRLARERDELRVVDDQHGAPTWSRMVAQGVAAALCGGRGEKGFRVPEEHWGVHHLTAAGATTWCGFARAILEADPDRAGQRCRAVVPIPTAEYPTPARRPRDSVLATDRARREFGVSLPDWREQLRMCLEG
jgi:dTDP-4-dehydrorhamnose reductase